MLVAENLRHGTQGGPLNPRLYRVNDDVFFAVDLFVEEAGKRTPLAETDVQVWCRYCTVVLHAMCTLYSVCCTAFTTQSTCRHAVEVHHGYPPALASKVMR